MEMKYAGLMFAYVVAAVGFILAMFIYFQDREELRKKTQNPVR